MSCEAILGELDGEQRRAATAETNVVVAAGAGSGKTKVLAARYAWLVMDRKIPVEEILTLTFTNKAVSEMYSRIYGLLAAERDNPEARRGIANFHQARISTLDSFSAIIARTAARRFGISSDFVSDEGGVRKLAMEASLPFVLEHRDNPGLQLLLSGKKIKTVAEELFAATVLRHSPISRPLDFPRFIEIQNRELITGWQEKTAAAGDLIRFIREEMGSLTKKTGSVYTALQTLFQGGVPLAPELEPLLAAGPGEPGLEAPEPGEPGGTLRAAYTRYFQFLTQLKSVSFRGRQPEELAPIIEAIKGLRAPLYGELEAIAAAALRSDVTRAVFPLVEEFQQRFNRKKREAGILTFNDIACLAVDALIRYPDIRQVYKDSCRAIMIDEFQDNNSLQRDLIFLLAEKPERQDPGIPGPGDLSPGKMFFVGDGKQSIYRFRGADVSVFRRLSRDLPAGEGLNLIHNYRSRPALIEAFNRIFGGGGGRPGVFREDRPGLEDFEAVYSRLRSPGAAEPEDGQDPPVHFCFLDKGSLEKDDPQGLNYDDLEAAFIAGKIRELVDGGYQIPVREQGKTILRPCGYGDIAALQRTYNRQGTLEKQCKLFGIPFNADRPAGLFNDAPVNDLYHLLRLLAYPEDRLSYAAVIRSPFTRLSGQALTVCLLDGQDPETGLPRPPFDQALEGKIPPEEREQYREARQRFEALTRESQTLNVTGLLTKLWFDEGYRCETLWSAPAQIYGELFDLLFEIARKTDGEGESLPGFIDYLAALMAEEERAGDLEVPAEGEPGVRIMSIHKSKGLEFPVVFIYGGGSNGAPLKNTESFFYSEDGGITLNLPPAEELPGDSGNYFFNRQKPQEQARARAELRRLLYVAMTRAESLLYFTASLPEPNKAEREELENSEIVTPEEFIKKRIAQLAARRENPGEEPEGEGETETGRSFLDLLLPALDGGEAPPFTIGAIPVLSRQELYRRASPAGGTGKSGSTAAMTAAAEKAAPLYAAAPPVPPPPPGIPVIPASSLRNAGPGAPPGEPEPAEKPEQPGPEAPLDRFLKQSRLDAASFGTIAHSFIEARFRNREPRIPPGILARLDDTSWPAAAALAAAMAEQFFTSELGRLSLEAVYRESEFPILTLTGTTPPIPVSGQIDLLFESAGTMHLVDFKTDRTETPAEHRGQLAVYTRAVSDIFGKPVRPWLFYLRSGHGVDLSSIIGSVDIEALVQSSLKIIKGGPVSGPEFGI